MPSSKPHHILYAEDDPGAAELFRRHLERMGYVVSLAADGEEALEMWQKGEYDVLCVDQQMPRMTGVDVIRTLTSAGEPPPIIMITGAGCEKVAVEALTLGAYDYVVKDVDQGYLELLPAVIETALNKKQLLEEKERAEQALMLARDELEIKVRERTAELASAMERLKTEIGERARAENEARREREFLMTVVESLTHPFYVIDARDYTLKIANSAAGKVDLVKGKTCYEITHRQSAPCSGLEHPCPVDEVRAGRKPVTVEHTHYDNKGEPRAIEIHAYPILNEKGEVTEIIHYSLDITERKRVEGTLRELLETSANIVHNIPSGLLVYQYQAPGELFLVNANRAACRILDISVDAWRGQEFDEMWPEGRRQGLTQGLLKAAETGQTFVIHEAVYKTDEVEKVLSIHSFSLPGQMLGVFFEDVTAASRMKASSSPEGKGASAPREKMLAQLAEANKHIETLERQREWADNELCEAKAAARWLCRRFPSAVMVCDRDGAMLDFNDRTRDLLGLPQAGASQRLNMEEFGPLVESGISRFLKDVLAAGEPREGDFRLKTESRGEVILSFSAQPFSDSDGRSAGLLAVIGSDARKQRPKDDGTAYTILVLSDSEPVSRILRKGLGRFGQTALAASSSDEAIELLSQNTVSVILCDVNLDPKAGWQIANEISTSCESYGIKKPPFILITQSRDEPLSAKKTARYGVDVELRKPVDIPRILDVVRQLLRDRAKQD